MNTVLYIVIPCYNEEAVIGNMSSVFKNKLNYFIKNSIVSEDSRILFVDDGSKDKTWKIIESLNKKNKLFQGIRLSCNKGHQNALFAGLMVAKDHADICISIDCDGQDDVNAMDDMIEEYNSGCDIVYGIRKERKTDSFFKRFTAECFYKMMNNLGTNTIYNHADYRLMSKRAVEELSKFKEVNLFLRGLIPLIGFHTSSVCYDRRERVSGKTHYSLKKMFSLALNGITSFSVIPLRIISAIGIIVSLCSAVAIIWTVILKCIGSTISGWTSTICILLFIGGIILLSLGIIGEYIGKIYSEVKNRPKYIISQYTEQK